MIKVKLEKFDERTGVREVSIKVSEKKIIGPTRTINSTELRYLNDLSIGGIKLNYDETQFFECRKSFGLLELELFSKGSSEKVNRLFINKLSQMRLENSPQNAISFFRPHIDIDIENGLPLEVTEKADLILRELAVHSDYDFVSIQDPGVTVSLDIYEKRMTAGTNDLLDASTINKKQFVAVPTIDVRTVDKDNTKDRCKLLHDMGYNLIHIVVGNKAAHLPSLEVIRDYFLDKDVALIGSNIPKTISIKNIPAISGVHHYQTFGLTTLSTLLPRSFIPRLGKNVHDSGSLVRFDKFSGFFLARGQHNFRYGEDLKCCCPICVTSKTLTGFYENHKDFTGMTNLKSKVHEVFASISEFEESRKYIGEMINYFKKREGLYELLKPKLIQRSLNSY